MHGPERGVVRRADIVWLLILLVTVFAAALPVDQWARIAGFITIAAGILWIRYKQWIQWQKFPEPWELPIREHNRHHPGQQRIALIVMMALALGVPALVLFFGWVTGFDWPERP